MEKIYILQNENTLDLIKTEDLFVNHIEQCRKDNTKHNYHKGDKEIWNVMKIEDMAKALTYYKDFMESFDYTELFVLDNERQAFDARVCHPDKHHVFVYTENFKFDYKLLCESFINFPADQHGSAAFLRIPLSTESEFIEKYDKLLKETLPFINTGLELVYNSDQIEKLTNKFIIKNASSVEDPAMIEIVFQAISRYATLSLENKMRIQNVLLISNFNYDIETDTFAFDSFWDLKTLNSLLKETSLKDKQLELICDKESSDFYYISTTNIC